MKADGVRHSDARVDAVEHAIRDTIRDVFGKDSPQFNRHHYFRIDDGPQYVRTDWGGSGASDPHEQRQFEEQMPGAITRLQGLIDQLEEKRADLGEPTIAPRAALAGRTIHPAILAAAERLYLGGHYTQAVFEAGKALISLVRAKSGSTQDGAPLMQSVFSVNNPILAFRDDLTDQSNKDEQQGMMHLYTGTVLAIRNPGGHRVGAVERPDRALQHLELLGYLADRLDEAKKVRNS
ncbi:MAG: TIGR02391 family protein [Acidobacteria bacterium RIFCSPLOWO2_02_FULL_68_18]|nr:MAG: TIGR02391 family protein [Acidobacteria bacterium RIFCSPLOWO2_02_FULL_68_18]OFW49930.1 MAG: TIGR02391 family protein [Acidobacteria bacterium RIFCSPLOWO2_12_FULL_68_19]